MNLTVRTKHQTPVSTPTLRERKGTGHEEQRSARQHRDLSAADARRGVAGRSRRRPRNLLPLAPADVRLGRGCIFDLDFWEAISVRFCGLRGPSPQFVDVHSKCRSLHQLCSSNESMGNVRCSPTNEFAMSAICAQTRQWDVFNGKCLSASCAGGLHLPCQSDANDTLRRLQKSGRDPDVRGGDLRH